jgi:type II restriction/modification system DNA methylase subunit YeeA
MYIHTYIYNNIYIISKRNDRTAFFATKSSDSFTSSRPWEKQILLSWWTIGAGGGPSACFCLGLTMVDKLVNDMVN